MIDSLSSGERTGKSLNPYMCKRCSVAVWGSWDLLMCGAARTGHVAMREEPDWKAGPERVTAP